MTTKSKMEQNSKNNHSGIPNTKGQGHVLPDDTDNGGTKPEGQTQPSREDDEEEVKRALNQISAFQDDNPGKNVPIVLNIKTAFLIFK